MCLENCLMIGIMMPVAVSCLSTLSPMNTETKRHSWRKTSSTSSTSSPGCLLVHPLPFKAVQSSSRQSELYHVHRFVTGGRSSPCLPCRTAFSCPCIMSAGDIQAWCDVAFTKGHVRHLRSACICRTGSRHMGAGIGHYPGPQGNSDSLRICQRDFDLCFSGKHWTQHSHSPRVDAEQKLDLTINHTRGRGGRRYLVLFQNMNFTISWCSW